jgi:SAM-dependent methyltransferase
LAVPTYKYGHIFHNVFFECVRCITRLLKAEIFVRHYVSGRLNSGRKISVIEIGAKSYEAHDTFRSLFADPRYDYTGLDVEPGTNVDIVPKNGYVWSELADDHCDVAISGQTFEHNPFFWIRFCEMARILKPGGFLFVIAPGGGPGPSLSV